MVQPCFKNSINWSVVGYTHLSAAHASTRERRDQGQQCMTVISSVGGSCRGARGAPAMARGLIACFPRSSTTSNIQLPKAVRRNLCTVDYVPGSLAVSRPEPIHVAIYFIQCGEYPTCNKPVRSIA